MRSGRNDVLLNLIKHQRPDTDKIYLYVKDPFESKYQLLVNRREIVEIKKLKTPKACIDYAQTIDDAYENLKDWKTWKSIKNLSPVVTELLLKVRKLNISLVSFSQSYFKLRKAVRLNVTHYFIMKNPHKRELQQIA